MKTDKELSRFTNDECIILASLAVIFFKNMKIRDEKEKGKKLPKETPEEIKLGVDVKFIYQILLDNANGIFKIKDIDKVFALGLIRMSIQEFGDLKNEKEEDSILKKMDAFFETIPI